MSEKLETTTTPRLTIEQLHEQVQRLCAENGYALAVIAIGKKSGKQCPLVDVIADTHVVYIAYVEVKPNGATP